MLLKFNIDFSIKNEQDRISLYSWIENHRAIKFYKKMDLKSQKITIIKSKIPIQILIR